MKSTSCTGGNVVIFGESGVGKSSIINMLLGENKVKTSSGAVGCTFTSDAYVVDVGDGVSVRVHDTVGLGEGSAGTVSSSEAIIALYQLLQELSDGVNLLVFVMRVGRIVQTDQKNYELFFHGVCARKVPVALILTHGDDCVDDDDDDVDLESAMNLWWERNRLEFAKNGLWFKHETIVIAKKRAFPEAYEASKEKIRHLISTSRRRTAWKIPTNNWFIKVVKTLFNYFGYFLGFSPAQLAPHLALVLNIYGGMGMGEATLLANEVESGLT
jgi:GTP-binding protein EngB required for normal cell division